MRDNRQVPEVRLPCGCRLGQRVAAVFSAGPATTAGRAGGLLAAIPSLLLQGGGGREAAASIATVRPAHGCDCRAPCLPALCRAAADAELRRASPLSAQRIVVPCPLHIAGRQQMLSCGEARSSGSSWPTRVRLGSSVE